MIAPFPCRIVALQSESKPLAVYDQDCDFCRRWIEHWEALAQDKLDFAPYQLVARNYPHIRLEAFQSALHLIDPDGSVSTGHRAVLKIYQLTGRKKWLIRCYRIFPTADPIARRLYRFVADHRTAFSRISTLFWGRSTQPPTYFLTRSLFLGLLGLIFLAAFSSLATQIIGLVGQDGILPARTYLDAAAGQLGSGRFWQLPTLCWIDASDPFLTGLCFAGIALSLLIVLNIIPQIALLLAWAVYLSLVVVGQNFLSFQWDTLLLETALLAVFFAPAGLKPRLANQKAPPVIALFMLRLLLFKLMFLSGATKLASGDSTWHNLTALYFHYETQPLPTWLSWYAHQLPQWCQKTSVVVMFAIELVVPFFIFTPRRFRQLACVALIFLQLLIALTGNYCFFNLLTLILCICLLDDNAIRSFLPKKLKTRYIPSLHRSHCGLIQRSLAFIIVLVVLPVSAIAFSGELIGYRNLPSSVLTCYRWVSPFRSINGYGLFRVMTTSRPEIIIEASNDSRQWKQYRFKYKPGDLKCRPRFNIPHQPRLDWQMWFAALGNYRNNPWILHFMQRLLEGAPPVLDLLEHNPFPDEPPRYIRAVLYQYNFTDWNTKKTTGDWWQRKPLGLYTPPISLRQQDSNL